MPFGLPGAVAICRTLVAKTVGVPAASPASATVFMVVVAGGGEDVGGGAVDDLLGEVGRPGEVQLDVDARVVGLELLLQLRERLGQRRGGEHGERARLRGRRRRRRRRRLRAPAAAGEQQRVRGRRRPGLGSSRGTSGGLDHDVRRLDHRDGQHPGLEPQLADGLAAHQRDDPVRPALHLHLGHHLVGDHLGDQPDEPVAGGAADVGGIGGRVRVLAGEGGQRRTVDDLAVRPVGLRGQRAGVDPPPTVSSLTPSSRAASAIRNCGMSGTLMPLLRFHPPVVAETPVPARREPDHGLHKTVTLVW